jgi:L-alanine-DL-glutamate epimerase-like enolase superfamily enzyme
MQRKAISRARSDAAISRVRASAYTVPTDRPEADGTFEWSATTMVIAEAEALDCCGLGYSYTGRAAASVVADTLAPAVERCDAMDIPAAWQAMARAVRNQGRPGICATAIAAVDAALWDLKGRLLDVPVVTLLGAARAAVPVYGSGGFTSDPEPVLQRQLAGWVEAGMSRVKMKVGRDHRADIARVRAARDAVGPDAELFVDANGAWRPATAARMAEAFAPWSVTWIEEPVTSDDLAGLARVRNHMPPGVEVAAGEYGYDLVYFRRMLDAGAVDVLQADATRCAGLTGFLQVGALCEAFTVPLSAHTAPALHVGVGCALPAVRHLEYFHDHVRIEQLFFDGVATPCAGQLAPDRSRPGLGFELKRADAAPYRVC